MRGSRQIFLPMKLHCGMKENTIDFKCTSGRNFPLEVWFLPVSLLHTTIHPTSLTFSPAPPSLSPSLGFSSPRIPVLPPINPLPPHHRRNTIRVESHSTPQETTCNHGPTPEPDASIPHILERRGISPSCPNNGLL